MKFNPLICWPLTLYFFLNIGGISAAIFISEDKIKSVGIQSKRNYLISQVISLIIGSAILFALCNHGYYKTAWVVYLLPVILGAIMGGIGAYKKLNN